MENKLEQVEDLLTNEEFLAWFYKTDANAVKSWEAKIAASPALKALTDAAVAILNALPLKEKAVPQQQAEAAQQRLLSAISKDSKVLRMPVSRRN